MNALASQMRVSDVLDRAADLIKPEGAWTQGCFARNASGVPTGLTGFRGPAVCWCLLGATDKATGDDAALSQEADDFLRRYLVVPDLGDWNDNSRRTQAEVVAKLREAAALAREQGK